MLDTISVQSVRLLTGDFVFQTWHDSYNHITQLAPDTHHFFKWQFDSSRLKAHLLDFSQGAKMLSCFLKPEDVITSILTTPPI